MSFLVRVAFIDDIQCVRCGLYTVECRFEAIHYKAEGGLHINPYQFEGCRLCDRICPTNAISSEKNDNNRWFVSDARFGKMVHARMAPGEENSRKLVTRVRSKAKDLAGELEVEYVIYDGSPGVGCLATASLTGTDIVLWVIEPPKSGIHDASSLIELAGYFFIKVMVVINK